MNRFVPFLAAALMFAPAAAYAQYDGVVAPESGDAAAGTPNANGFSGDGGGYDQQFQKQGTPNNIYEFVNKPDTKNNLKKMEAETAKKREAMVKRMQANSTHILEQQKERAWKIANPGKPYHADGVPDEGLAADVAADDGSGDTADGGGDDADQGGDDGGGDDGFAASNDGGGEQSVSDGGDSGE